MKKENWEKEFDKEFNNKVDRLWRENTIMKAETSCEEELKSFIRQLLEQKDQEWRERIEKAKKGAGDIMKVNKIECSEDAFNSYNQALQGLLDD